MIKRFDEYMINESTDLSYKSFFGKEISHKKALEERIKSSIVDIMMNEKGVSEKSFKQVDDIISDVNNIINDDLLNECELLFNDNKRINFIAEIIYDKYIKT